MKPAVRRVKCIVPALAAVMFAIPEVNAQSGPCAGIESGALGSRDLYCLELLSVPEFPNAVGRVELGLTGRGVPFTLDVSAAGVQRYHPTLVLENLPPAASLGDFTTYVAWVMPPTMYPATRLGVVANGMTRLQPTELEQFIVLVTAESSAEPESPGRRAILRGQSPSTRLQPPELVKFVLGTEVRPADSPAAQPLHDPHAVHGTAGHGTSGELRRPAGDDSLTWSTVPMPAGLQMLPAEMALRPDVAAYLPAAAAAQPARPRKVVRLRDGDTLQLTAGLVTRSFKGRPYTVYAFNGQYPGPLIEVTHGAAVTVILNNALDQPTTVHWHGIRLDNASDGVPGLTQEPVQPGDTFIYRLRFPDAGVYWYHPHVREDAQQDLGLYGNLLVRPRDADYFGPAHREEILMLDDLLIDERIGLVPYGLEAPTHALMGRFGNVLLVNGEPGYSLRLRRGEVVRFMLTNAASTRTFNLSFGDRARLKLVGSDVGNYERETWVESVVIAPAERYIVDVRFDAPGDAALVNRVRGLDHLFGRFFSETDTLGVIHVEDVPAPRLAGDHETLRAPAAVAAELAPYRLRLAEWLARVPDRSLVLTLRAGGLPFLTRWLMQLDSMYFTPVEWSGTMPMMNWAATGRQLTWVLRDPSDGSENMDVRWRFRRGELVKLRLTNERETFHAMQHPIHLHGQRFLILAVNGAASDNLVWKDTVLIPAGATVDLLVEMSNPGRWMLHCHTAEHLSADMMLAFTVE